MSNAAAQGSSGWGNVHLSGSIIDTACAIDTQSIDQTIDMGATPLSQIARNGQGRATLFSIRLVNCVLNRDAKFLPSWRHFAITFDGTNDNGLFGVDGEAKGVALKITDSEGNIAIPGKPLPSGNVETGDMSLKYSLQPMGNHRKFHAGDYTSIIKFKMDYY